eukprot:Nitzschia sp. Nitz4//scaffold183_size43938//3886//6747//NITZ4_007264-RA/size43938-processed-gene-0.12-mRNA-1//-1//CDS//3329539596//5457//frame0
MNLLPRTIRYSRRATNYHLWNREIIYRTFSSSLGPSTGSDTTNTNNGTAGTTGTRTASNHNSTASPNSLTTSDNDSNLQAATQSVHASDDSTETSDRVVFPWRHEEDLLPRLVEGTVDYELKGELLTTSTRQPGNRTMNTLASAFMFLEVPLYQFLFFSSWKADLAESMSWAFTQGVAALLSNFSSVPVNAIVHDEYTLKFQHPVQAPSTQTPNKELDQVLPLENIMDKKLLDLYQSARNKLSAEKGTEMCLLTVPYSAELVSLYSIPYMSRAKASSDKALHTFYKNMIDKPSGERSPFLNRLRHEQLETGQMESTVIAQVLVWCNETFYVKDPQTGDVLQGTADHETSRNVPHLVRFEMTVHTKHDTAGSLQNIHQNWIITDIDDMLEGNIIVVIKFYDIFGAEGVNIEISSDVFPTQEEIEAMEAKMPGGEHGWFESSFQSCRLHYRCWLPKGEVKGAMIYNHGVHSQSGKGSILGDRRLGTNLLIDNFNSRGIAFYTFDMLGHGYSEGTRFYLPDWKNNRDDVIIFCKLVAEKHPGVPMFVGGESYGGALAIHVGRHFQDHPDICPTFKAILLAAPGIAGDLPSFPKYHMLRYVLAPMIPKSTPFFMPNPVSSERIWREKQILEEKTAPRIREMGLESSGTPFRLGTAVNLLLSLEAARGQAIPGLTIPFCIIHGDSDYGVPIEGSQFMLKNAASSKKELHTIPGAYHDLMTDPLAEEAIVHWMSFVDEQMKQ